jgi:hypothetical protein
MIEGVDPMAEHRLHILKMLQEKKISVDEAERLIRAIPSDADSGQADENSDLAEQLDQLNELSMAALEALDDVEDIDELLETGRFEATVELEDDSDEPFIVASARAVQPPIPPEPPTPPRIARTPRTRRTPRTPLAAANADADSVPAGTSAPAS